LHKWAALAVNDFEWPGFNILLDSLIVESSADQTSMQLSEAFLPRTLLNSLNIEDGVGWVHSSLVLCSLTDQSLLGSEGDERRCCEASLLIGDYNCMSMMLTEYAGY
jgi:NAD-specific glutamate dehydrogenase